MAALFLLSEQNDAVGLWRGVLSVPSPPQLQGPPGPTHTHTHRRNMQTNHARTPSLSTHVQTVLFNLLTYGSMCRLFIYLFIDKTFLSPQFLSAPPLPKNKRQRQEEKNRPHLARSPSTTALYTVSLKQEC